MAHAEIHHLDRAPITEAVIDIRVQLPETATAELLAVLPPDLAGEYSNREELHVFQGELQLQLPAGLVQHSRSDMGIRGYRFISTTRNAVVQMRLDGFTFSKLRPYTDWENVLEESQRLWAHFATVAPIEIAHRLAVRYINNFPIPAGRRIQDYLTDPPVVPEDLPHRTAIRSALSRLVLIDPENQVNSIVTKGLEVSHGNGIAVVIDIDSYKAGEFPVADGSFWNEFAQLHETKNRIFFGSLTPTATQDFE